MKKLLTILSVLLVASSQPVNADWSAEIGYGYGAFQEKKDGTYYQEQMPHEKHLDHDLFRIGAVYNFDAFAVHGGYIDFGKHMLDSEAIPDNQYSPMNPGGCYQSMKCDERRALFRGTGHASALYLTLSTPQDNPLYLEAGLLYNDVTWHFDAYNTWSGDVVHEYDGGRAMGKMFSVGWNFDGAKVIYTRAMLGETCAEFPTAVEGYHGVMLMVEF
jgi:hypothetical protein